MNADQSLKLAGRFIGLPLDKRRTFLAALEKEGVSFEQFPIPAGVEADDRHALSYAQQRMWFLWALEPTSGAYNLPAAVRLKGTLDRDALEQAFAALVERHETLRTVFQRQADGQVQQVPLQAPVVVQWQSLSGLGPAQREQQVVEQAERMAVQPFDLVEGPLLRIRLLELSAQEHVLLLTLHHIVADGWSLSVLIDEFIQVYEAFRAGQAPALPALPIQYRDYALWQRRWLEAGEQQRQLDYWLAQLGNDHPALELPTDHPRPAQPSQAGRRWEFAVDAGLAEQLRALARRQEVSLFVVLLAAFNLLLQRYSGQNDIRVGTPIANRNRAEVEGLIGFFVNTQVLRNAVDGQLEVGAFLQQVKGVVLGAQAHQDLPFEQLVEALRLERDASRTPLFQVMYNHQPEVADIGSYALPSGLALERVQWQGRTTQFDLTLDTYEKAGELHAALTYATDLFEAATIERLAGHWVALLQALVDGAGQRLCELPMLADEERGAIVGDWNKALVEHPVEQCIHQVIAQQAREHADSVAVTFEGQQLTYAQLNGRANALAHELIAQGVGPDVLVGLAVERSLEMVIGLLAILKAGGAYVPLDPAYPQDRLAYMIEDSGIALLLAQSQVLDRLPVPSELPVLLLGDTASREDDPITSVSPDNLAYVIYTSGSTGKPKGTLLPHRNVLRLFSATDRWFDFGPQDVWTLFHSYGFDFSVWEIFGALLYGGRLLVVPQDTTRSPRDFYQLLCEQGVTVLNQTPSAFKALMQVACSEPGEHKLRQVIFGGEALDVKSLRPWFERFGDQAPQLVNMYGITETTVHVTYRPLTLADLELEASSPIGEPIEDLSWYLLDGDLNPVPKGCVGELYVGKAGLARGYLNRGDLSATRFIPDPFSNDGGRLYRTGDLARYQADGVIEYIGRIDHQVKIRGFRIELGEIEARLLAYPAVGSVAVLPHGEGEALQLVAYVVPKDTTLASADPLTQAETRDQIKAALRGPLPEYMVPAHLLFLAELPLTTNGKLDRKALPAPDASLLQQAYVEPQGPLEMAVAQAWAEVLQLPQIGAEDDFFALGGHSLLATQVVSRLSQVLGMQVPLKRLFEHSTLRAFAASLDQGEARQAPLLPAERNQPLLVSFAQERQWYLWQLEPQSTAYHIPTALHLRGTLDVSALERAFNTLIERHETLRTTFQHDGTQLVQVIAQATPLRIAPQALGAQASVEAWVEAQARQLFDLAQGPLLRVGLLRLSDDHHVLALTQHHIVSDAWSMQRMVEELLHAYEAFSQGGTPQLPALPVQYADYALWQRARMAEGEGERQLAYWVGRLGNDHEVIELPLDRPRPAQASAQGATLAIELPAALTARLKALAQAEGATLFMLLLASLQTLLHRYSRQPTVRVGVPVANRHQLETEGLIGFFVNTQVLPAHIDPQMPFTQLLRQVRQTALDAQAHQDLPFEQLVEALQPQRSTSHHPLFQVLFNHQAQARRSAARRQVAGLSLEGLALEGTTSQFDLMLDTFEGEQGIEALFTYATDLFEAATIERLAMHWQALLQGMVEAPQQRVADLPLLADSERRATLGDWNKALVEHPVEQCLHQVIAQKAREHADNVAVTFEGQQLTYAQLNGRANALAHELIAQGVGPDVLVGLAVERSLEMVVGLLAILKAGGAYVPLDPAYPLDRLAYMIEDSGIALLLAQPQVLDRLPVPSELPVLLLGDTASREDDPITSVGPDNLAYVIYTSGSTGKPKGTLLPHRNVLRLFSATDRWFDFGPQDVWTLFHSYGFDFSVWEIFGALLYGGRLLIVPQDTTRSPRDFYQLLCGQGVTVLNQTPSAFKALMQVACSEPGEHKLRQVIFGGEALDVKSLRPWFERFGDQAPRLVNMYGITETTVHVTYRPLTLADLSTEASSPIGEPIEDLSWYLLDGDLNPVPKGCVGELYVGKAGLARGYLNRGDLSATRFIPDPFSNDGGRLYRTGDLARYQADGVIEYIGRIDHQVKIRGFRIELGEIEARLLADPAVGSVAVLPHGEGEALQLVTYVVPKDATLANADPQTQAEARDRIKAELRGPLPEYMVPAHLLFLTELPLTTNGKLDRKALPAPDASLLQQAYVAPQSDLEQRLALIWQDVLGVERVGLNDDFFALGGHSLLATQVISRLNQALDMQVPLKRLFEHSTLRAFAASLDQGEARQAPLLPAERNQPLLVSFAQERQWYLWQLDPQSTAYHIPTALHLRGALNVAALEQAFSTLIQRHETLRTTFHHDGKQLVQVIGQAQPLHIAPQTLGAQASVEAWVEAQASQLFDLAQGPLLRVGLLRLSDDHHVLALTQHHIVSDAWSMQRMVEELLHAYEAFSQGGTPQLPALPVQYADYALWQRARMAEGERERQLAYWMAQLGNDHEVIELPLDHPRPAQASARGATFALSLAPELAARLKGLAQAEGATLFMLLLASLQTLLHRYSRQPTVRVGVPVANRHQLETEGLIGFFVNTQVLQAQIDPQMPFTQLLRQVRQTALDAQAHQDLPFEQLVEALQPQRTSSHHPLFQVLFNHQAQVRQAVARQHVAGLSLEGFALEGKTSQFDLMLDTFEAAEGIEAQFTYATDLFEAATIERLAGHWVALLQALVGGAGQRLCELPMLADEERGAIVGDWNKALVEHSVEQCLHQVIARKAREHADSVAVTFEGQELTYAQLNGRANALAHELIAQGVGPDVLVGLAVERSLEMVVGLLAILKAGGAYVPLDPAYPQDRLAYMIEDSGIALLLAQPQVLDRLPVPSELPVLLLGDTALREDDPITSVSPDNLAYVIYTSGSTGKPKGTLLPHRNVLRLFSATDRWFDFGPQDVWTLFHSYGFDFSVWEIFGALLYGGRLLVVPQDTTRSPREFYQLLCEQGVTVLNQTPSAFKALMQVACNEPGKHQLRQVIFGGEALDVKSLRPWFERFGDQAPQLVNMYGITETTVHVTYRPLTLADLNTEASSPIGEPIEDLSWYLLDGDLNPVPKGCVGELYVGKAGLARGYLNRGDLSATRFIPDPFSNDGGRLYRTGDLARYQADGVIEYIGRIDHQVKIRGFRIELGEIEARLLADPAVGSVAVLPHGEGEALQLVAYVVPKDTTLASADPQTQAEARDQIKAALRGPLPEYMVPAHLLFLAELPLTTNGKLDRKALPAPDASLLQQAYVAPQSDLEQRLALIWQDVLGVERVGLNDDFFALGGHSLQLVMLLSRIRGELDVELKIREFHGLRTLGELAAHLEQDGSAQARDAELDQIFGVLDELEMDNV